MKCSSCGGTGKAEYFHAHDCESCSGTGEVDISTEKADYGACPQGDRHDMRYIRSGRDLEGEWSVEECIKCGYVHLNEY